MVGGTKDTRFASCVFLSFLLIDWLLWWWWWWGGGILSEYVLYTYTA